ncbi:hypothetical protein [Amycolatopsis balhimycina]|uniref:hypothetical protein n=1 Tax=Amycolatopsis balhimycina TaxID=208443 RepID=UPI0003675BAB|nr:hypothetical protein [Amycolatopsis balhimycina]
MSETDPASTSSGRCRKADPPSATHLRFAEQIDRLDFEEAALRAEAPVPGR